MPLNRSEPDAAEAEDGHRVTRLNLGRVVNSADAGGHTATQQADMLGIGVRVDLGQRDFGHHRVFAEGRAAHVVVDRLAVVAEAGGAIGHHALALGARTATHRLVLPDLQNRHSPHSAV